MKFSQKCSNYLSNKLCINTNEFESTLKSMFGNDAHVFDSLVIFMINDDSSQYLKNLDCDTQDSEFQKFESRCLKYLELKINITDALLDYAHEIICYFHRYYCGGLIELFKFRQAECNGPKIYLNERIVPDEQINSNLPSTIKVYRGMSLSEFKSGDFGMSWSLSKTTASRFAKTIYSDQHDGVVVEANIKKDMVFYYDPADNEKEVVVKNNSIKNVSRIYT